MWIFLNLYYLCQVCVIAFPRKWKEKEGHVPPKIFSIVSAIISLRTVVNIEFSFKGGCRRSKFHHIYYGVHPHRPIVDVCVHHQLFTMIRYMLLGADMLIICKSKLICMMKREKIKNSKNMNIHLIDNITVVQPSRIFHFWDFTFLAIVQHLEPHHINDLDLPMRVQIFLWGSYHSS